MAFKLSVVIPALNEEGVVGKTISSIPTFELEKLGLTVEVIVVDNGSVDGTFTEAKDAGATVVKEEKKGYGNAYLSGFSKASGDFIVMFDADGTYPAERVPDFIKPLLSDNADFVIGTRMKGDIQDGAMPWLHKHVGNPILTKLINILFNIGISDAHCGMRAIKKRSLDKLDLKSSGMEFASEMLIQVSIQKLRITEIPITYRKRGGGKPKLSSIKDGTRHLKLMLSTWKKQK